MKVDNTMFYGRARRIDLLKKVVLILVILIALILLISFIFKKVQETETNVNFEYLRN